jgi:hypothetical protein
VQGKNSADHKGRETQDKIISFFFKYSGNSMVDAELPVLGVKVMGAKPVGVEVLTSPTWQKNLSETGYSFFTKQGQGKCTFDP